MRRMARSWHREVMITPCGCGIRAGKNPRNAWTGIPGDVTCLAYAPDGAQLASGSVRITTVRLWDPRGEKPPQRLDGHTDEVKCLAYAPDGAQLASGSGDKTVRLWDPRGEKPPQRLDGHTDEVRCLAYAPDGAQLASGSVWIRTVRLWDPRGEKPPQRLDGHTDTVTCLAYAPDGAQLASGSEIKPCGCGIRAGKNPRNAWTGIRMRVTCLAYAPDGAQLASGSEDNTVRLWDTRTGGCLMVWPAPAVVTHLLWRADRLFIGCNNGLVAALQRQVSLKPHVPDQWLLAWLQCGNLPVLNFSDCDLTDVQGLQPFQIALIEQRGGKNLPLLKLPTDEKNTPSTRHASFFSQRLGYHSPNSTRYACYNKPSNC